MTVELSPKVFVILSGLVEERTGLSYTLRDIDSFAERVSGRMREAGFESALDYYYYLRYDPASAEELAALVASLVVTETYFFREVTPLRVIVDDVLRPAIAAGRRPRVWSAACASGEEPLTLAMLLDEQRLLPKVEIIASDLSLRALERARSGGWGPRSLRAAPPEAVARWMRREGDRVFVEPRLLEAVAWRQLNLLDAPRVRELGSFDVVLCRNVLIYFSDPTILRVVDVLASVLVQGGRLVVGASESLLRFGTVLECEERGGAFFYRRSP